MRAHKLRALRNFLNLRQCRFVHGTDEMFLILGTGEYDTCTSVSTCTARRPLWEIVIMIPPLKNAQMVVYVPV